MEQNSKIQSKSEFSTAETINHYKKIVNENNLEDEAEIFKRTSISKIDFSFLLKRLEILKNHRNFRFRAKIDNLKIVHQNMISNLKISLK
jgi:hypothetical protein